MPTKDIADAGKPIRDRWEEIKRDYFQAMPGKYLVLTCVYRSPSEQFELFKKGRTQGGDGKWTVGNKSDIVTNVDGVTVVGAHNYRPSRAVDVMVVDNQTGKATWDIEFYLPLHDIAVRYGLEWGGDWKSIKDYPHLQFANYKSYIEEK